MLLSDTTELSPGLTPALLALATLQSSMRELGDIPCLTIPTRRVTWTNFRLVVAVFSDLPGRLRPARSHSAGWPAQYVCASFDSHPRPHLTAKAQLPQQTFGYHDVS
jgi:hypothetical protein